MLSGKVKQNRTEKKSYYSLINMSLNKNNITFKDIINQIYFIKVKVNTQFITHFPFNWSFPDYVF